MGDLVPSETCFSFYHENRTSAIEFNVIADCSNPLW